MDIEFLQRLCTKVNIIPVIAKADTLTPEEMGLYKHAILRDFDRHDIRVYPNNSPDADRETSLSVFPHIPLTS
jgi:septin family protein